MPCGHASRKPQPLADHNFYSPNRLACESRDVPLGIPAGGVLWLPFCHWLCHVNYATFQLRQPRGVVGNAIHLLVLQASYDLPFSNYATRGWTPEALLTSAIH